MCIVLGIELCIALRYVCVVRACVVCIRGTNLRNYTIRTVCSVGMVDHTLEHIGKKSRIQNDDIGSGTLGNRAICAGVRVEMQQFSTVDERCCGFEEHEFG